MTAMLRAKDVRKRFGGGKLAVDVLLGVDLEVCRGELVLLMGPSGAGKTTLLCILAGLLRATSGEVELCGAPISAMPDSDVAAIRRRHLGFVFQTYNLFPALTALENVAEILALRGLPRARATSVAAEALARVGLERRLAHRPAELSGGEKQRVAIARALAGTPSLVIGDEITGALDMASARAIMSILRESVSEDRAVLLVTHDHRMESYADVVFEMEDGRMVRKRTLRKEVA